MFFDTHTNRFRIRTLLFLPLLAVAVLSNAQKSEALLRGTVQTRDGKPATPVNVQLKETGQITTTNEKGEFEILSVQEGRYVLILSFAGMQTIQATVEVYAGNSGMQRFTLAEDEKELAEIVVTASRSANERMSALTKMPVRPMDLPQAVSIIGKEVLERQQVLHLSDVLQNVNGVYVMGTTGGYQEEISARGFSFGSANTFKNGIRYNNSILPEMSSVEKVEFLKGGSAILFGNVTAGGVMNVVTRKPKFTSGGEISFRTGSYDFYKPSVDLYGSLNKKQTAAFRINTTYETAGSFRDLVKSERLYMNPSLLFKLSSRTELLVEGDYLTDHRTPDFGTGAINYEIAAIPRSAFLGIDWGYNDVKQSGASATLSHALSKNWQLKGVLAFQNYNSELFAAARPNANSQFVQTSGNWIRGLQKSKTAENYYLAQLDLTGKMKTGTIEHTILAGADADRYQTAATTFVTTAYNNNLSNTSIRGKNIYDTITIYDPYGTKFSRRNDIPYLAPNLLTTSPVQRLGVYVQDLVALHKKVKLLAGVRYSIQQNKKAIVDTLAKGTKGYINEYTSEAFSPRLGLVYQPAKFISVFTSYTNNFSPNTGVDTANNPLRPSIVDQFELGVKTDLFKGLLSFNITAYQIVNSDFALSVVNPPAAVPAARELTGEVTSKGWEADITTKAVHGFSFLAGYSYNDTRYTRSNNHNSSVRVCDRLRYNPAHTANGSVYYHFQAGSVLKGFSVGTGFFYTGNRVAGRNTTTTNPTFKLMTVPDYTLFDIHAGYTNQHYSIRVKISNLTNVLSYNIHDDNSVNPIAPRQFSVTAACRF